MTNRMAKRTVYDPAEYGIKTYNKKIQDNQKKPDSIETEAEDTANQTIAELVKSVEQFNASQLQGKERKKHRENLLLELGGKLEKTRHPMKIQKGLMAAKKERSQKEKQRLLDIFGSTKKKK